MLEQIQNDLRESLKNKDEIKVSTLRLLIGAIKNFAIEKESTSYVPTDEEIVGVVRKEAKKRKESIEQFEAGGRNELVEKETKELQILESYLPAQMSEKEVEKIIEQKIQELGATSAAEIGKVMGTLSQELKGKADMGFVSSIVRKKLT